MPNFSTTPLPVMDPEKTPEPLSNPKVRSPCGPRVTEPLPDKGPIVSTPSCKSSVAPEAIVTGLESGTEFDTPGPPMRSVPKLINVCPV